MTRGAPPVPQVGGMLDFNANGIAGCTRCGWRGVPSIIDGAASTFCPSCEGEPAPLVKAASPVGRTPRNAPCPCGSGAKFKKCCGP